MDGNDDKKPDLTSLDEWRQAHGRRAGAGNAGQPFKLHHRDSVSALGHPRKGRADDGAQAASNVHRDSPDPALLPAGDKKIIHGAFSGRAHRAAEEAQQKPRILLIEPEPGIRKQLKLALQMKDYEVTAPDAVSPDAYQKRGVTDIFIEGRAYDLVIYGDMMKPTDAANRHDRLLNNRFGIPVIMLTNDPAMQSNICSRSRDARPQVVGMERQLFTMDKKRGEWPSLTICHILQTVKHMLGEDKQRGPQR